MKYVKMLGLAAVAAAALMALVGAGTASAKGTLCSAAEPTCAAANRWAVPTTMLWSLQQGGSAHLEDTSGNTLDTCTESTVDGDLTSNTAGGEPTATGNNTSITWGGCTATTDTTKLGKLKIAAAGGGNGTLIADEEIKVTINIFGSCEYGVTAGTKLGTITEGKVAAGSTSPIFHAEAVATRLSGLICPSTAKWTATYVMTK